MSRRFRARNDRESLIDRPTLTIVEIETQGKKIMIDFRRSSWSKKNDQSNDMKDSLVSRSFQSKAVSTCRDDEIDFSQD